MTLLIATQLFGRFHSLRTQLFWSLALVALATCAIAGAACFYLAKSYVARSSVEDESRYMAERGRRADLPFERVETAHAAANRVYQQLLTSMEPAEVDRAFEQAFTPRADGTRRMPEKYFDGAPLAGRDIYGMAGFMSRGEMTPERKKTVIAAIEAIRTVAVTYAASIDSLAFALPTNDLIIFAPNRPDRLNYYRNGAPADFPIWKYVLEQDDGTAGTRCEGPIEVGWDPTGRSLAAGCQTLVSANGEKIGAWDTTLPLNRRLVALLKTSDRVHSSLVANVQGQLIVSPELGFAATSNEEALTEVSALYDVAGLVQEVSSMQAKVGAFESGNGKWLVRYHLFDGPDWILIDLIDRRSLMFEAIQAPMLITMLFMAGLIGQALLVGAMVQQRFVHPLHILMKAFGGKSDAAPETTAKANAMRERRDEIGALANTLIETTEGYDVLINELEDRVRERTEKYQRASEAKSEFLANMSHEIRKPMNGILGMAELLTKTELCEKQKVYADTIHRSGSALLTILNDILDFSKIEAGKLELDPHPFDMRQAVEEVATLLGPVARSKSLELVVRYAPDLPTVVIGDAGRIRQILTNLVGNAIKFTHEGHVLIDIKGAADPDSAHFDVEIVDTGIGIPANKIASIFEQFTQSDNATTRKFGGTGLGLAITKSLVEEMSGDIGADSTLGAGSRFWFRISLPVAEHQPATTRLIGDISGVTALIVDDLDVNRQILEEQLTLWGIESTQAASGEAALNSLRQLTTEDDAPLILLDYHMPGMDGLQFAEKLRSLEGPASTAKFIVLSSASDDAVVRQFKSFGAQDVLSKPVPMEILRKVIANACAVKIDIPPRDDETVDAGANGETSQPGEGRRSILVADDNQVNRLVIQHMIDASLYNLTFAENGRLAVEEFKNCDFDLILMDISMPEMDGIEATKAIRSLEAKESREATPIIALTAHAMAEDQNRFLDAGMDDYLPKPVSGKKLDEVLDNWIIKAKAAQADVA